MTRDDREKFEAIIDEMEYVYKYDNRPWLIGFSGGKDSTMLCMLLFKMLQRLKVEELTKKIFIYSSDTMVENPIVKKYMYKMSQLMGEAGKKFNVETRIIRPEPEHTFWANLIGLGYQPPEPPGNRWCTERLKIKPANTFTQSVIDTYGEIILLLGVRKAESTYRARGITAREVEGKILVKHKDFDGMAYVYNPLTEISNQVVWEFLLGENSITPWGSNNKELYALYQGEDLPEEESALGVSEEDKEKMAVTGNSRFGCWTCTMVKEDKSLKNFIEAGHEELKPYRRFRNWLIEIHKDNSMRDNKRRKGDVYIMSDGSKGPGPFTLETRRLILSKLFDLEKETGDELITTEELKIIDQLWEKDGDLYRRNVVDIYFEKKGKRLPWDTYRQPLFTDDISKVIHETCQDLNFDEELVNKLVIAIEHNKHKTKGNKVEEEFKSVMSQGWIHFDNIKAAKEEIHNENK